MHAAINATDVLAGSVAGLNCENVRSVKQRKCSDKRCAQNLIHLPGELAGVLLTGVIFSNDGISLTCHASWQGSNQEMGAASQQFDGL